MRENLQKMPGALRVVLGLSIVNFLGSLGNIILTSSNLQAPYFIFGFQLQGNFVLIINIIYATLSLIWVFSFLQRYSWTPNFYISTNLIILLGSITSIPKFLTGQPREKLIILGFAYTLATLITLAQIYYVKKHKTYFRAGEASS